MWLFHFLMKKSVFFALHMRLASKKFRKIVMSTGMTIIIKIYPQVLNCWLRTYETDENTTDTKDE